MTKQKQIEEMAKSVCRTPNCKMIVCADIKDVNAQPCDKRCRAYIYATRFYNAGYRKATDVAREIFEEIKKPLLDYFDSKDKEYSTMKIKSIEQLQIAIAHYQGATNAIAFVFNLIAELKKKYTEEVKTQSKQ